MSAENPALEKDISNNSPETTPNGADMAPQMSAEDVAKAAARFGYGPLARVNPAEAPLPAFGGEAQPGRYTIQHRKFANPAPLGLSAFALTTFVLSCINMGAADITKPNIVIGAAFGYGGLVQLCSGMWEMAVGNTFGATALSSYGGFWFAVAIILTPGFQIESKLLSISEFHASFGLFLMGWFIFTTILLICTLKSTVAFFLIFLFLDLAFLMLGVGYLRYSQTEVYNNMVMAGGLFGLLSAFAAWYNAFAGIADSSNSFFIAPVVHFPWSDTGRSRRRQKTDREAA